MHLGEAALILPAKDCSMCLRLPVLTRLILLILPVLASCQSRTPPSENIIFLVRHAERADDGMMTGQEDPHLSDAGKARAGDLARVLADANLTDVYSTDYMRTRETAGPTAEVFGLTIGLYNADSLEAFADGLKTQPGRHLVVGHSNTTPRLVAALGGDPHGEIAAMEYDRLYVLDVEGRTVRTVLLRFGQPYQPTP
jgi:broad specificity phosphatase PhoE